MKAWEVGSQHHGQLWRHHSKTHRSKGNVFNAPGLGRVSFRIVWRKNITTCVSRRSEHWHTYAKGVLVCSVDDVDNSLQEYVTSLSDPLSSFLCEELRKCMSLWFSMLLTCVRMSGSSSSGLTERSKACIQKYVLEHKQVRIEQVLQDCYHASQCWGIHFGENRADTGLVASHPSFWVWERLVAAHGMAEYVAVIPAAFVLLQLVVPLCSVFHGMEQHFASLTLLILIQLGGESLTPFLRQWSEYRYVIQRRLCAIAFPFRSQGFCPGSFLAFVQYIMGVPM